MAAPTTLTANVPAPTFGATGFIAPASSVVLAGVQEDINAAFGGNLNFTTADGAVTNATPQGQLAASEAALIGNVNDLYLYYTQQVDPAFAAGRMQDAIARIYFIERNPAQPTVVQALCSGLAGVSIPTGAIGVAADGNQYVCTEAGVIPVSGSITLTFQCTLTGPIACPAGTLNEIFQSIPGWDSITNPDDGVEGNNVETRSAFEARRAQSVAHNSIGSLPSIVGAVLTVPNVIDALVLENDLNTIKVIGDYTLGANSLYVAVVGGEAQAIAEAIWTHKAPGCSYNGNTTVTVLDSNSGYTPPFPAYLVSFEIPNPLPILFAVTIANGPQVPSDAATQIQNAIISAFAGGDGGPRARIGTELYASRFYTPVAALGSWVQIVSIEVGCATAPSATFMGSIAGNTLTVTSVSSGALAMGQTISDAAGGMLPGTQISSLGTGTGGAGTYTITTAQTIAAEPMTAAVPNLFRVSVNIDQVPTISAANISVALA